MVFPKDNSCYGTLVESSLVCSSAIQCPLQTAVGVGQLKVDISVCKQQHTTVAVSENGSQLILLLAGCESLLL